jgi:hypothetical protein
MDVAREYGLHHNVIHMRGGNAYWQAHMKALQLIDGNFAPKKGPAAPKTPRHVKGGY